MKAWVLARLRQEWRALFVVLLLSLVASGVALLGPYLTKRMIDDGLLGKDFSVLWQLALLSVLIAIGAAALNALNRWCYLNTSARFLLAMRRHVFSHLLNLSPHFFQQRRHGDVLSRLDGDVGEVQRFAVDSLLASFNGLVVLIGALTIMLSLNATLTFLAFVLLPATVWFLLKTRPLIETQSRAMRERVSAVTAFMVDHLPAVKLLQSFSATSHSLGIMDGLQERYKQQLLRSQMLGLWVSTVPGIFNAMGTALVFTLGGYWVIQGDMTLGTMVAFSAYLGRATGPVQTLLGLYVALQRAKVSLGRLDDMLHIPSLANTTQAVTVTQPYDLLIDRVSFQHPGRESQGLREISASIPEGSVVCIQGVSGSGKSTLMDLLQRHFDPNGGEISLCGVPLRRWPLAQLRENILLVAQDAPLLDDTLRENLCLGFEVEEEKICFALKAMCCDELLSRLPKGLDTRVGARGAALSGGERQRLALARAYLRSPKILILDEATSALDSDTEIKVINALKQRFTDCTLLIVTHRDHALWEANWHWVLEESQTKWAPLSGGDT